MRFLCCLLIGSNHIWMLNGCIYNEGLGGFGILIETDFSYRFLNVLLLILLFFASICIQKCKIHLATAITDCYGSWPDHGGEKYKYVDCMARCRWFDFDSNWITMKRNSIRVRIMWSTKHVLHVPLGECYSVNYRYCFSSFKSILLAISYFSSVI